MLKNTVKKLAIITPGFKPVPSVKGGAIEQLITDMLIANEATYNYDIDVYTIYDRDIDSNHFNHTNIIYVKSKWYDFFIRGINFVKRKFLINRRSNFDYLSYMMEREFKTDYYDIVLVENNMDTFISLLKKIKKERLFFHLHNDFDCNDPAKTESKTQIVINNVDGILTVSNYLKEKLEKYGAKNVFFVPNFVKNQEFNKQSLVQKIMLRSKYHFEKNDVIVTYIGRLDKEKGVDKLLEAIYLLRDYPKIKCLIVGESLDPSSQNEYNEKINRLVKSLKERVVLTGYIKNTDLASIYAISNFIVIPSQCEEAFGLVALEAMKMRKAVIASESGGLPEVLSVKGAVILKKGNDFVTNLAMAIKKLSEDKKLCKKMGEYNYKKSKTFPQNSKDYFVKVVNVLNGTNN